MSAHLLAGRCTLVPEQPISARRRGRTGQLTSRRSQPVVERLSTAYRVAALIAEKDCPEVAQAWFQGMNPQLEDFAPARVLREVPLETAGPKVLAAARAFAAEG